MTLRLILMRHAKSAWGNLSLDDHDRPLNARGEKSARAVGQWLAERGHVPDRALVSSSRRTRETWAIVAQAFDAVPEVTFEDALYLAEPDALMAALRAARGSSVMMIAHNPGIAYFAQGLVRALPGDARFERYPTAATAVIDFAVPDWATVTWNVGTVTDLVFARDLV